MSTAKPSGLAGQKDGTPCPRNYWGKKPAQLRSESTGPQRTFLPAAYGYARVSRGDHQSLDRQLSELTQAGVARVFTDEVSGGRATSERPGFADLLSHLRPGDHVTVVSLDRLSRSLSDIMTTLESLVEEHGVTVTVLGLGDFDPRSPLTRILWQVLGAVAELERALIRERTLSGLAEARRKGTRLGRPPALDELGSKTARSMSQSGASVAEIGRGLSVSERTVRRVLAS